MGACGRSVVCVVIAAACGPSPGDQGDGESGGESSTTTSDTASEADGAASDRSDADETSEGENETSNGVGESSTSDGESSTSDGESSTSTGEVFECECGPDETCFEIGSDSCNIGQTPRTTCIEIPASCEGAELTCEGECGWEICGGTGCSGPQTRVCGYVSPGFVCSPYGGCNIFTQDCGVSETCVSFDGDDDGAFDQAICTFRDGPTVALGEPCSGRHQRNGIDNCEPGSMCVGDSASSTTGVCRAPCVGNPWNASCIDPTMQCVLEEWFFAWCLPA